MFPIVKFLKYLIFNPIISLLDIHPKGTLGKTLKDIYICLFIAGPFIIKKNIKD